MIARRPTRWVRRVLSNTLLGTKLRAVRRALRPPAYPGVRLTLRRLLNLYLARYQRARGHTRLLGYPPLLTLEATNVCNLGCPYCFTGTGEVGRKRSMIPMRLYEKVLDELGAYLFYIELCNWGEPLLNKNIYKMARMAADRGISSLVSTNFSFRFNAETADELVSSGLAVLGVSIDGARQESYERYRVRGDLDRVLANVRLVNEAKSRLGSDSPHLVWEFHVFEWNKDDIELGRAMAEELGMEFAVSKGWVAGEEWERGGAVSFGLADFFSPWLEPERCKYLWLQTVINNDGSVAPCCGSFYEEDDYGSIVDRPFKKVWNNRRFREARRMFGPENGSPHGDDLICRACPVTLVWKDYQKHRAAGGQPSSFVAQYTMNDGFNYFFARKPDRGRSPDGSIELKPVTTPVAAKPTRPQAD